MSSARQLSELEWEPVRPSLASGVYGRTMLDAGVKMVYTRVEPGGEFPPHVDRYGHLFYILKGTGVAGAGGEEYQLVPGLLIKVEAGERHFYRNTGTEELELISMNL
jgi:quercetin dioxygenase-like cupin family protein